MPWLFVSQDSIRFFIQAIVALVIILYLLSVKRKSKPTWLLIIFFGMVFMGLGTAFWMVSLNQAWVGRLFFTLWFEQLVGLAALLQFTYYFPEPFPHQQRERQLVLVVSILAILTGLGVLFYSSSNFTGPGFQIIFTMVALQYAWAVLVLLRRTARFSNLQRGRGWIEAMLKPQGRAARATRAFALLMCFPVLVVFLVFLTFVSLVPPQVLNSIFALVTTLYFFGFVTVYSNFAAELATMRMKLVLTVIVTVLLVMDLTAVVVMSSYQSSFQPKFAGNYTLTFRPTRQGGYEIKSVPFRFDLEGMRPLTTNRGGWRTLALTFPFYYQGQTWTELAVNVNGVVYFDDHPSILPDEAAFFDPAPKIAPLLTQPDPLGRGQVFYKMTSDTAIITWQKELGVQASTPFQLVLRRDASFDMSYGGFQPGSTYRLGIHPGGESTQIETGILTSAFSRTIGPGMGFVDRSLDLFIHERAVPFLYLVVGATLLALMTLPLFFQISFIRPLEALQEGVRRADDGDLEVVVPVRYEDEIGFLTQSFNSMIGSIKKAREQVDAYTAVLEASEQKFRALFEDSRDAIFLMGRDGQLLEINQAALELFGYSRDELQTLDLSTFYVDRSGLAGLQETLAEKGSVRDFEVSIRRKDGDIRHCLINGTYWRGVDGEILGHQGIIRDITEQKKAQRVLEDYNRTLERQVARRTAELAAATQEAEEARVVAEAADRSKSAFLASTSHELRTPLTSVVGFAKIIQKRLEDRILPHVEAKDQRTARAVRQVRENIGIIVTEGERLTAMINNVLDLAKIEAGKVDWQQDHLTAEELIERAIAATTALFQQKSLTLKRVLPSNLPAFSGDRDKLLQVLINLLSNAVKFTESGSVTCRVGQVDGRILFSVSDTGIGIAPEDQNQVFEKFKQVGDTLTGKPQGTGLGLPICKEIIEHHGGRIWLESEVGQGSSFFFTVPLQTESPDDVPVPEDLPQDQETRIKDV